MRVTMADGVHPQATRSPLFADWLEAGQRMGATSAHITDSVVNADREVLILMLKANYRGRRHSFLLRNPTVEILTILNCEGQYHVATVTQERIAAGGSVCSNAAGSIDFGELPEDAAKRERGEEIDPQGILRWGELINLNDYALGEGANPPLGSPGGSNEKIHFFANVVRVTADELLELIGSRTGVLAEGEHILVGAIRYERSVLEVLKKLAHIGVAPDLKLMTSLYMYQEYLTMRP